MKFIKRLFVTLLVLIALILIVAAFLPSKKHIEESMVINAPASMIFKQVNNLQFWQPWSPFYEEDTNMKATYEGPEEGKGAIQKWQSEKLGNGSMEITESTPHTLIKTKLTFEGQGISYSDWKFEPDSLSTRVTWSIDVEGLGWPLGRIAGLFMSGAIHKSFKKGLTNLKKLNEDMMKQMMSYKTGNITVEETPAWMAVSIRDSSSCDKISQVMGKIFTDIRNYLDENKIEMAGPPYAMYYLWDNNTNRFDMEAGIPVKNKINKLPPPMKMAEYPSGKAATAIHFGAYESMYNSYTAIEKYIGEKQLQKNGHPWEVYVTDPEKEKDMSKWETRIYFPLK